MACRPMVCMSWLNARSVECKIAVKLLSINSAAAIAPDAGTNIFRPLVVGGYVAVGSRIL